MHVVMVVVMDVRHVMVMVHYGVLEDLHPTLTRNCWLLLRRVLGSHGHIDILYVADRHQLGRQSWSLSVVFRVLCLQRRMVSVLKDLQIRGSSRRRTSHG